MNRIALLFKATPKFEDDNYLRFAKVLSASHEVTLVPVDSLQLLNNQICGEVIKWRDKFKAGDGIPDGNVQQLDHDLVWILSIGDRRSFLDKYQLLYALSKRARVINSLESLMHLKSKYYLATQPELFPQPETHASSDAANLAQIIREQGGQWIIKPPAGSLGRDVFLVNPDDTNLNSILEHLCGMENTEYTMIQRYVPEIAHGEKRVLLAGGTVIDQYRRLPTADHRTNVTLGAEIEHCELTAEEQTYCERLAKHLLGEGVYFCGIDLAWPWLIETNVINPGGIVTLEQLTGIDRSQDVLEAVLNSL